MNSRDKIKVQAALVLLRDNGHDPGEVTELAQTIINNGTPAEKAYERAFSAFIARVPSFQAPLQRLGHLVEASDVRTVSAYSHALKSYIATGNRAHLDAILPTVQQDMSEMARRTGDAGFADGLPDEAPQPVSAPVRAEPTRPGWGPMGYSGGDTADAAHKPLHNGPFGWQRDDVQTFGNVTASPGESNTAE